MQPSDHSPDASSVTPAASVSNDAAAPGQLSPELKAKWIAALRSGEYQQGDGQLRGHGGYCCLGVLASICGADMERYADYSGVTDGDAIPALASIPIEVRDHLANYMNDDGKSFAEIADYIEKSL